MRRLRSIDLQLLERIRIRGTAASCGSPVWPWCGGQLPRFGRVAERRAAAVLGRAVVRRPAASGRGVGGTAASCVGSVGSRSGEQLLSAVGLWRDDQQRQAVGSRGARMTDSTLDQGLTGARSEIEG